MKAAHIGLSLFFATVAEAGAGAAAAPPDPMEQYREFETAYGAYETDDALKHIERAYSLAEVVWGGSDRRTAKFAAAYADHFCGQYGEFSSEYAFGVCNSYADPIYNQSVFEFARNLFARCSEILSKLGDDKSMDAAYCLAREGEMLASQSRMPEAKEKLHQAIDRLVLIDQLGVASVKPMLGRAYLSLATTESPRVAEYVTGKKFESGDEIESRKSVEHAQKAQEYYGAAFGTQNKLFIIAGFARAIAAEDAEDWPAASQLYEEVAASLDNIYGAGNLATKRAFIRSKVASSYARIVERYGSLSPVERDGYQESHEACRYWSRSGSEVEICILERSEPIYPKAALAADEEGFVLVQYDVTETGRIEKVAIFDSWPKKIFDQAAIDAVKIRKYAPPKWKDGSVRRAEDLHAFVRFKFAD